MNFWHSKLAFFMRWSISELWLQILDWNPNLTAECLQYISWTAQIHC